MLPLMGLSGMTGMLGLGGAGGIGSMGTAQNPGPTSGDITNGDISPSQTGTVGGTRTTNTGPVVTFNPAESDSILPAWGGINSPIGKTASSSLIWIVAIFAIGLIGLILFRKV